MKKQFKNILKINLIIGKKQNLVMRKKKAVRGRNIIIANGEKKISINKKKEWYRLSRKIKWGEQKWNR